MSRKERLKRTHIARNDRRIESGHLCETTYVVCPEKTKTPEMVNSNMDIEFECSIESVQITHRNKEKVSEHIDISKYRSFKDVAEEIDNINKELDRLIKTHGK